jgi:hypothetical protein
MACKTILVCENKEGDRGVGRSNRLSAPAGVVAGSVVEVFWDEPLECLLVPGVEEVGVACVLASGGEPDALAAVDRVADREPDRRHLDGVGARAEMVDDRVVGRSVAQNMTK